MAHGFWKGLLHGAVISVAGLAGLSLLTPVSDDAAQDGTSVPEQREPVPIQAEPADEQPAAPEERPTDADGEQIEISVPEEVAPPAASEPADSGNTSQGPEAATMDLPVGSEFGRGGDVVPHMPAPMESDTQSRHTDAPAVSAPTAEPAPVAITDPGAQPATGAPDAKLTETQEPQSEDAPEPDLSVSLEAPDVMKAPQMIGSAEPDEAPAIGAANAGEGDEVDAPALPEVVPVEKGESQDVADPPALPSPVIDLSTPPDLSDLRVQRE